VHRYLKIAILIALSGFLLWGGLIGCGSEEDEEAEPVVKDLQNYLYYFEQIAENERDIAASFESVTGEKYTDDETMHQELVENTLPKTEALLDDLRLMEFATPEVQQLHESYISGWENQKEGFQLYIEAVEEQDQNITEQGNQSLDKGSQKIEQVIQELNQMMEEYNLEA